MVSVRLGLACLGCEEAIGSQAVPLVRVMVMVMVMVRVRVRVRVRF